MTISRNWHAGSAFAGASLLVGLTCAPASAQEVSTPDVVRYGGEVLGQVDSQVGAIVPYAGGTSLPMKLGVSGARLDADVATASSGVVDLGLLGALGTLALVNSPTLKSVGVPTESFATFHLPGPITADSRNRPAAESNPVLPKVTLGPLEARGGHQRADAPQKGPAKARTEMGAVSVDLGLVKITLGGGVSETSASAGEVTATTSLGEVRFDASGASPVLRGLEWRLVQRLGQPALVSFSIGSAQIGPTRFAFDSPAQFAAGLEAFNQALAPTGLRIAAPVATAGGISPLIVQLKDSALAARFVGPLYSQLLADGVNQLESTLVAGLPETGLAITVANIGLAALVGRGGAALELGGVAGGIGRRPVEEFRYGAFEQPFRDGSTPVNDTGVPNGAGDLGGDVGDYAGGTTGDASAGPQGEAIDAFASLPAASRAPVVADEKVPVGVILLGAAAALATIAGLDRRRLSLGAQPDASPH